MPMATPVPLFEGEKMLRKIIYSALTIPVFGLLYFFTAVIVLITLTLSTLRMDDAVRAVMRFWAQTIFLLMGKKLTVRGLEHIKQNKNYILLANHGSLFDIVAIIAFYPHVAWFGRERLLKIPVFGRVLKMIGYVPMKSSDLKNTKKMMEQLVQKTKGSTVAVFPEGTRTVNGRLGRFHRGFIHIQRASGLDILPVTLNGLYSLKPKHRQAINFSANIEAIIHKPLSGDEISAFSDREILRTVKDMMESVYNDV